MPRHEISIKEVMDALNVVYDYHLENTDYARRKMESLVKDILYCFADPVDKVTRSVIREISQAALYAVELVEEGEEKRRLEKSLPSRY